MGLSCQILMKAVNDVSVTQKKTFPGAVQWKSLQCFEWQVFSNRVILRVTRSYCHYHFTCVYIILVFNLLEMWELYLIYIVIGVDKNLVRVLNCQSLQAVLLVTSLAFLLLLEDTYSSMGSEQTSIKVSLSLHKKKNGKWCQIASDFNRSWQKLDISSICTHG